ncbi:MAG: hypothetical protein PHW41_10150 [Eubacteriales bacterium]|nr:hypothetical protein [Eubacteriales bacterium]
MNPIIEQMLIGDFIGGAVLLVLKLREVTTNPRKTLSRMDAGRPEWY